MEAGLHSGRQVFHFSGPLRFFGHAQLRGPLLSGCWTNCWESQLDHNSPPQWIAHYPEVEENDEGKLINTEKRTKIILDFIKKGNLGKFTEKDEETGKVTNFGPMRSLPANKALYEGAHICIIALFQIKNRNKSATAPHIESVTSLIIGEQRQRSPDTNNLPASGAVKSNAGPFKDAHIKYYLYYPDLSDPYPEGTPNPISVEYEADTRTN